MKKISLIILPLLLIVGCSDPVNISNLTTKDDLVYRTGSSKTFSGKFYKNDLDGNKKIEGIYKDGILKNKTEYEKSGYNLFTQFFDNGNKKTEYFIISKALWKSRKYDGPRYDSSFTSWYQNYNLKEKGTYKNGLEDGVWNEWYEDGQKKSEANYKNGLKDGVWTIYRYIKNEELSYKDGKLISLKRWNEDGSLRND